MFDEVFRSEGLRVLLTAPQAPRMNAIMERWAGSARREILGRILILNAAHLRTVLAEYENHFNEHRPHLALSQASPLKALPDPIDADIKITRHDRLGGLLHEYSQAAWGGRVFGTYKGAWRHQAAHPQRPEQQPGQCGEYRPVGPVQPRFRVPPPQHRDLVAQDQQFGVVSR
jgi:hypothetical protein